MTGARTSGYEQGSQVSSFRTVCQFRKTVEGWLCLSFVLVFASLCMVTPLLAQQSSGLTPPQQDMITAIFTLCPALTPTTGATEDLRLRCTEVVANSLSGNAAEAEGALLPMAPEEVVTQATNSVETSIKNIGARLVTVRAGATGLDLRRFSLNIDGQPLPGTLVASLMPIAAAASSVSTSTPPLFKRLGLFVNGNFSLGDKDATSNEAGFDFTALGVTAGADYRFTNHFVLGLAFDYAATNADIDNTDFRGGRAGGKADTDSYTVSAYGTYYVSDFYVDGIVSYGWNNYDIDRNIIYNILGLNSAQNGITSNPDNRTGVNQTAHGDTDGTQFSFSFGAGYDFSAGGFTFGPLARMNYIKIDIDAYREEINNSDAGFGLNLAFDSQNIVSLTSVLGGQASYALSTGVGVFLPHMRVAWEHEFEDDSRTITARFIADPANTPVLIPTDSPDRDFVNLGVGLSAVFAGGFSAFVDYQTALALDNVTQHSVTLGVRKEL